MEIIALQDYTDKYVSLYEGEVRNIGKNLANRLIAKGVVAEHDEIESSSSSGGSSSSTGGGIVYIEATEEDDVLILNASYNDIVGYIEAGKAVYLKEAYEVQEESGYGESGFAIYSCGLCSVVNVFDDGGEPKTSYQVIFIGSDGNFTLNADTPSDNLTYAIFPPGVSEGS